MRTSRKLSFALASLVVVLGAVEGGFRVSEASRARRKPSLVEFDALCGYHLRPGLRDGVFVAHRVPHPVNTNALGHRGPDLAPVKPADGYRVACLGGSTTFGFGASSDAATWPAALQARLQAAAGGRAVEVLNAGTPGWNLRNSLDNYVARLDGLGFDLVVIKHGNNDLYETWSPRYLEGSRRPPGEAPPESLGSRLLRSSAFMQWAARRALKRQVASTKHEEVNPEGLAAFERNLEAAVQHLKRRGTGVLLCTYPHAYPPTRAEAEALRFDGLALLEGTLEIAPVTYDGLVRGFDAYNAAIREVARREGVELLDLAAALPRDAALYVDYIHQNDEGMRLIGERVAERILAAGWLAPRGP